MIVDFYGYELNLNDEIVKAYVSITGFQPGDKGFTRSIAAILEDRCDIVNADNKRELKKLFSQNCIGYFNDLVGNEMKKEYELLTGRKLDDTH